MQKTPNREVYPKSLGAMLEYWYIERGILKEQCNEDFAVLGQFCAEIITLRLKS